MKVMRFFLIIAIVSVALAAIPARTQAEEVQRVIVQFVPGNKDHVRQLAQQRGAQIHYEFDELNALVMSLPASAVEALAKNPNIRFIEEDTPRYPQEQVVPYGVDNVQARQVWDANLDGVVDAGAPSGAGRMVCIIDSGVTRSHEDLASVNFAGGYPKDWSTDTCGHGTHVAGTIAAAYNSQGVVGVTPGTVSLYIVKVYGDSCAWVYSSTLVDAAQRCQAAGANVISMSLSGIYYSSFEANAFQTLYNQGVLSIAAAGNGGGTAYGYPASYPSVVSVAAVDQNNVVASFSRKNDQVEIAAPGVSVYSTYKDGGYVIMSGTSMSTPHVSAAAAIIWSSDPSKTNAEVRAALQLGALDLGTAGRDTSYGYGALRVQQSLLALNPVPTAVEMAGFQATLQETGVRLAWETMSEVELLGFSLYRAESFDGTRTQLNASLIPSQMPGSPMGATYEFVDGNVQTGKTYVYWLEALDSSGQSETYGPVSVKTLGRNVLPSRPRPSTGVAPEVLPIGLPND